MRLTFKTINGVTHAYFGIDINKAMRIPAETMTVKYAIPKILNIALTLRRKDAFFLKKMWNSPMM